MIAGRRLWRTTNGDLVEDGDPAGVTLAYGPGDQLTAEDEALIARDPDGFTLAHHPAGDDTASKRGPRPADKSRRPTGDKTRGR